MDGRESGYPYVIASSLPLEKQEDGTYTAHTDGLPAEDLTFTLYSAPELSLYDKITSTLNFNPSAFLFLLVLLAPVLLILGLILAVVIFSIVLSRRRRK